MYARSGLADDQRSSVLFAAVIRKLSASVDGTGRAALSGTVSKGRSAGAKYPDRTESAPGSAHHEEGLMHGQRFIGPWPEV